MRFVELFAGIGGFSLGFERAGMECVGHVEIDKYAQKVLLKHWPKVPLFSDVKEVKGDEFGKVDLLCGGFPCQDISTAGKQKGLIDENGEQTRSGLYDEIIRIAGVCRPRYIVLENVANLLSRPEWFGYVLARLAEIGYDAEWEIIRASDVGAPHQRARIWIVAYPSCNDVQNACQRKDYKRKFQPRGSSSGEGEPENVAYSNSKGLERGAVNRRDDKSRARCDKWPTGCRDFRGGEDWPIEPDVGRVVNGVPSRVDRLKCLGNALVPQIAEFIANQILIAEG